MLIVVTKNNHTHDCTTQAQLDRFLAAGWKKAKKQPKQIGEQPEGQSGEEKQPED